MNIAKPFLTKIFKFILNILKYPFIVKSRYGYINAGLTKMGKIYHSIEISELRKMNVTLVNLFILLPLFLGIIISTAHLVSKRSTYIVYYKRVTAPLPGDSFISQASSVFNRLYLAVKNQPIDSQYFYIFFGFYGGSIAGAYVLSKNPVFMKEIEIKKIMENKRMVDNDENPWEFTWTPYAMYFKGYNCDPELFYKDTKFWNTINFKPGPPMRHPNNTAVFVIPKKYEIPNKLKYDNKSLIKQRITEWKSQKKNMG